MTFEEAIFIGLDLVIEGDGTVRRPTFGHRSTTDIAEENRYGADPEPPQVEDDAEDRRKQAHLRCREQVALKLYERDFSILSPQEQNRIIQMVQVTVHTYDLARDGRITPLPKGNPRRAELEPELFRGSAS